jgi:hypothetical protein
VVDESFEDFKKSFSYGTRSDLSFKFLKALDDDDAADFFAQLLTEVGELFDGASPDAVIDLVYNWQVKAYTPAPGAKRPYKYDDRPFQPLASPLAETTIGLVTSSGHYAMDDPPSDGRESLTQDETTARIDLFLKRSPELSAIPVGRPDSATAVRHPGYDIRSASRDLNVTFPLRLLSQQALHGRVGSLADTAYSFVGACAQGRLRQQLDGWIERWRSTGIEALFLVPV